ncbi:hypothetical protein B296_00042091, partial [Ensete ventricosum]
GSSSLDLSPLSAAARQRFRFGDRVIATMNGDKDTNLNLSDLSSALPSAFRTGLSAFLIRVTYVTEHYYLGLLNIFRVMELLGDLISGTHSQYDDLRAKFFEEKAALEAKYQKLYEPLYIKRYEIVNGVVEVEGVTDEGLTKDAAEGLRLTFAIPPQFPDDDDDEIDEDTAEHLQNQLEQDYDIGTTIRDKIIPHAVSWFTGEAVPEDDYEDMEEDDDDEDGADVEDDKEEGEDYADDDEKEGKTRKKIH